jgi:DNA helicase-2/ATP-dependent DNA helicase PcrA
MKKYWLKIPVIFSNNSEWINFLTCHSSKWLEFETVFFIWVWEKWENSRNMQSFIIPWKINKIEDLENFDLQEKRRLFYTTLTRAKKNLQISFPNKKEDWKELWTCRFIDEILNKKNFLEIIKVWNLSDNLIEEYTSLIFNNFQQKKKNILNENLIKEILENYKLSFSDFWNYLKCPVNFYFEKIIKPSWEQNGDFALWNATHFVLDVFYKKSLSSWKILSKKYFMELYNKKMTEDENNFPKNNFKEMKEFWETIMKNYFEKNIEEWKILRKNKFKTEFWIECFLWEIPLKWRIDKINFDEKNQNLVEVIDFKTAKIKKPQLKPFENDENCGWDLWLQIAFYKLLVENYTHKKLEFNFWTIDSIRDNEKVEIFIKEENFDSFKEKIKDVYKKIKNAEFKKWCGDLRCYWCEILREINSV